MVNTRIQYYNDAQSIKNLVNEFNNKAYQPNNFICNLLQAIIEISSASGTSMIAEKFSDASCNRIYCIILSPFYL